MPKTQTWYAINAAKSGEADVRLYDEIGLFGISADEFVGALDDLEVRQINLYVNSPGGRVDEGKAIFNALQRHPARVKAVVDGWAASAASFIVQAAEERIMAEGAVMMIHDPYVVAGGNVATLEKAIEYLNTEGDSVAEIYAKRAGGEVSEWRERMRAETWYKAADAIDAGLADRKTAQRVDAAALADGRAFNLSRFQNMPEWAKNALETAPEPPKTPADRDHGWQFLAHHDESGAVDRDALRVAMARVKDLSIPIRNREEALHHLNGHAVVAARAA